MIKDLYEKYKKDIFAYLINITHDKTLSEDLTSETFLSAIKSLANFKGKSSIKTWLFSIARHKWYEHLRREKDTRSLDIFIQYYIWEDSSPENLLFENELSNRIIELLSIEDDRIRDIVMMRIEGYSFYEISSRFNISEGSARVIDFRTKRKLRERLIKEGYKYE